MKYGKFLICLLSLNLFFASCSEDPNYKAFFPHENGEKPEEFIYAFSKDYEFTAEDASDFIKKIRVFAKEQNLYEENFGKSQHGRLNIYFVGGAPMKYLLRVQGLTESLYRVQISCYPKPVCELCKAFISGVDSKILAK